MQLRTYQQESLEAITQALQNGVRQQLIVMATGVGKTCIAASLPGALKELLPGKLLFIAHTGELLSQAVDKIQKWNPALKVGLEKAEHKADPDCDVVVACNASVGRAGTNRLEHFWDDISVIVIDEAHHILGGSYLKILEDSGVLLPESNKLLIGLTATPKRHNVARNGQIKPLDDEELLSLKSVFKKIVYNYPLRKAIKEGFLVPLKGLKISTETHLDSVKTTAGDFQADQLSEAVNTPERNAQVVKAWKDHAEGRQTVCFTVDIAHAQALAETFMHAGVLAQAVWGTDPQRAEKLSWFENGKVNVLCNCALLTEGFDSPTVSCMVLARPTKSGTLYTQMVGRGTRLNPGKEDCIVLDVCDNYKRCSLVTLPSLLGLNPEFDLQGESITVVVDKLEEFQEKYPSVDFTGLTDITKVKTYVESLDLFAEPYSEEVKEFSTLSWMATAADGTYVLAIPEKRELQEAKAYSRFLHEKLHITPNELDEYELSISTAQTDRKLGVFSTLQEAFTVADDVMRRCRADRMKLVVREAGWHKNPASDAAKRYLRKLTRKKPLFYCLCSGGGSTLMTCPSCGKKMGMTAGQAALALNILKAKGTK